MDYLDVADEIRITIPAPKVETNQPAPPRANPPPQTERAIWVRKISGRPWSAAAKEYVPELKPIFAAQKIPPALVWVADVESSFDRRAESPVGAAGLFQLMPATAKQFGLSLWPRDQRFQTEPSATAAAQYLKYLSSVFRTGVWPWPHTMREKALCKSCWIVTKREATMVLPDICPQKLKCMCRGSKPSSCSVKARS
jgi:membrane-bound lytic murein transglycosylase D